MSDKGKRVLDANDRDDSQPEPKRQRSRVPALASVIDEAMIVTLLQRICSEPILQKMVREEVERALAKLGAARIGGGRNPPKGIEGPDGRNLKLCFTTRLSTPIYTGGKVEGENSTAIHIKLLDAKSGQPVCSGPEASVKLDVVVLDGDFNNEGDDNWTQAEFQNHIVKEREGKRPLLVGELQVSLKDGTGTLGELSFTDNSCWTRSRTFRLGLKIASGCCEGVRIREAKTEALVVKDHRGELYKKHYPPALKDEVWRLEKIGKCGQFQSKLHQEGIKTVEDFLKCYVRDPHRLREILGGSMANKMWESLVDHAKTCTLNNKYYIYYQDERKNTGAIFNVICEFHSLMADGQFYSAESLSDRQKDFADALVKHAYSNWDHVEEYDGSAYMKNKKATDLEKESLLAPSNYPTYNQPVSQIHSQSSVALHQQHSLAIANLVEGGPMTGGCNENQAGNTNLAQNADLNAHMPTENANGFFDENYGEGIWNADMQDWFFSMGGASTSLYDSGFDFSLDMPGFPNFSIGVERSYTSDKPVVAWLKIKAAMRWGIFVRKKAAERRAAQLVELVG